ncbi:class III signal peptide-containing protein [Methanococcus maripaludis]|uniref:Class III signal peptide n=2 Tax=Methanococcus maripaludis TaxID=39152 RepID=A0A7J9PJ40_METMI|nr:class III signal peptide-containing protein [Methanococcus maripaludis]MBA2862786.1 hypothetical protein [Methanococcus maripaludis]
MILNSKKGQLSIEMVILILAILLSGTIFATYMTKNTGSSDEISDVKKQVFSGTSSSLVTISHSNGHFDPIATEDEEPDEGGEEPEEENNFDKIYAKVLNINPTSSDENNKFEATIYGGGTIELKKKGNPKGVTANGVFYNLENSQMEFNVTKVILRIKGDSTIIINDSIVFDKNNKKFTIECVEGGTCPIPVTIGMENGAGSYWLELDVDDVKVTSESSGSRKN